MRVGSLDALRTFAVALVFVHHALSLAGSEPRLSTLDVPLGRIGTALFVALAGALAALTTAPTAGEWLWRRLSRIYPAYWLVMAAVLIVAVWTGYKPVSPAQGVSQLLGLGLFTHPSELVHVATWFVSLILLLYGLTALAKHLGPDRWIAAAIAVASLAAPQLGIDAGHSAHASTYFAAYVAFRAPAEKRVAWLIAVSAAMGWAAVAVWPVWTCGAIALALIGAAIDIPFRAPAFQRVARYSYEFYLTNGPVLAAAFAVLPNRPLVAALLGLLGGAAAAVVVQRTTIGFAEPRRVAAPAIA